jgi:hypothetical protein
MQLYRFTHPEDEAKLLEYANTQFIFNRFWVEGGDGTNGVMVSNQNQSSFTKITMPVTTTSWVFCEYQSLKEHDYLK